MVTLAIFPLGPGERGPGYPPEQGALPWVWLGLRSKPCPGAGPGQPVHPQPRQGHHWPGEGHRWPAARALGLCWGCPARRRGGEVNGPPHTQGCVWDGRSPSDWRGPRDRVRLSPADGVSREDAHMPRRPRCPGARWPCGHKHTGTLPFPEPQGRPSGVGCKGGLSGGPHGARTCLAAMSDPFCMGGGRRLPGSSKSGPGKDGSRNEVRLPVRHDPPKLGKRVRPRSTPSQCWGQATSGSSSSWVPP